jgi:flagellar hook-associated protein 1 FlgK
MGVTQILDTGKQALIAQQKGIQVAGQNISNVNTPGYSRERAHFVAAETSQSGQFNFGVSVDEVTRVFNHFLTNQVNVATTNFSSAQAQSDQLRQVESLFNDLNQDEAGLSATLNRFFDTFQDLASNPQGFPERTLVQTQGETLVKLFNNLGTELDTIDRNVNQSLTDELEQINVITGQIAELNAQIQKLEANPLEHANTLRDERDVALKQLAERLPITSFETKDGSVTVLLAGGRPLVEGASPTTLVTGTEPDNPTAVTIQMKNSQGALRDVTASISSGKLHGLLNFRDTFLAQVSSKFDRLAAQLISSVNQIHANGYGLDGSTGNLFFTPRQVTAQSSSENTGGATVQSVSVFDPTQLKIDDYQLKFAMDGPPPTFDVVNTTSGATVLTGQSYTAGNKIYVDGIELVLSDTGSPPKKDDVFLIKTTENAAITIALDADVQNDIRKIAAGQTPLPGDNANGLAIAELRHSKLIEGSTLGDFYTALVSDIGLDMQDTTTLAEHHELLLNEAENQRESLSGVSLEEEQLDLIRFQQAFQAAARLIQVADEMTDIVVNLIR